MIYLLKNTAAQLLYLTLKEGELLLANTYTHYLLELTNEQTLEKLYAIPTQIAQNDRYTTIQIGTNANTPLAASLLINYPARFSYIVYGQNSSTNLDPADAVVEGVIEKGYLIVEDITTPRFTEPNLTIDNDIAYNG
tara:strand:+ start:678 stop:1088 length:411 start_codon:yes stop_codon:yes gene_type:complete